jgi:Galactose oxidase, central domain/Kelch motif
MKTFPPVTSRSETITRSLGRGRLQDALCPLATTPGRRLALPLFFLCAALLMQPCAATPFQWEFTASLNNPRFWHTATLLSDGTVLVAGGGGPREQTFPYHGLASTELYDPATGNWTVTGSLNVARLVHTETLLADGRVLVTGGWPDPPTHSGLLASAEIYDPATGTWTRTVNMNVARGAHTATLLLDGRVLVVGSRASTSSSSAELYDPATGNWTLTGSTVTPHYGYHTATLLPNGMVLVAGGHDTLSHVSAYAELYDPATGTWTATGSLADARHDHRATLLDNGTVLVEGGAPRIGILASAELYDPATGTWTRTGSMNFARWRHTATLLPDGKVLVAGGINGGFSFTGAEIYDPATGTWTGTGSLNTARFLHTATLLPDGTVLAAGGNRNDEILASAELYDTGIVNGGINLLSAASRLTHGTAGTFDVNMPLGGPSGVEDRSATTYNAVFTFDQPVTSGEVSVVSGTATVGTLLFSGNSITAPLTGVTVSEVVTLHVQNVNGDGLPHGDIPFGFLTGDADANRTVAPADKGLVQSQLHQPVTSANFREDLDLDGQINSADVQVVRTNAGNSIP